MAELAAAHLGLPVREVFECSTEAASPVEGSTRLRQVRERLRLRQFDVLDGAVLLVDEYTRSMWALTQAAHLLADIGVDEVVPAGRRRGVAAGGRTHPAGPALACRT